MKTVESTAAALHLPAGSHPSITEDLVLEPGQPQALAPEQAAFALTFAGVISHDDASTPDLAPIPETPAPDLPEPSPEED